ncbi:ABC transporter substrate-binding protein [Bradyrhizobium sp. HKCCYLS3013]|uniref:ABC transporter substrate-binding protein n=1 Tax=Bradyrhizobium sp. HKCCYLS3013 TaxID=3420735 RepID=UPI003EC12111
MRLGGHTAALGMLLGVLAFPSVCQAGGTVEVLHWWTSGGEAKAIATLKSAFEAQGGKWIDSPVAGGGGDAAMTALRARVVAGNPPSAVQLKGPNIQEWARQGVLTDIDAVARAEKWDELLPPVLASIMKFDGKYVAAPVNIHRVNWIWANPAVLAKAGVLPPTTWDEFNAAADKLKAAGITPLAHGGQPWQDATLFETVVLGLGGADFYRKALVELDEKAITSSTMIKVFDQMRKLRSYVSPDFSGRDWNLATATIMNGQAGFQLMGDWAKGEFVAAGKVAGQDFLCIPAPGLPGFILNSDSIAMFKVNGVDKLEGQKVLASLIMSEGFQETFSLNKGSIPARLGVPRDKFDSCAQKSMDDLAADTKANTLVPSMAHEMAVSRSVRGEILDVVTNHFNSDMSSQDAVKRLMEAIRRARS